MSEKEPQYRLPVADVHRINDKHDRITVGAFCGLIVVIVAAGSWWGWWF